MLSEARQWGRGLNELVPSDFRSFLERLRYTIQWRNRALVRNLRIRLQLLTYKRSSSLMESGSCEDLPAFRDPTFTRWNPLHGIWIER